MRRARLVPLVLIVPFLGVASSGTGGARAATTPGVTLVAVGDTILGNTPDLPAHPRQYLSLVEDALAAPLSFANLEGTLTTATHSKCGSGSSQCFAFRNPPSYGGVFADDGFDVMNSANNHSHDFGDIGLRQTTASLHNHGIAQTGLKGEITVVRSNGFRLAFLGFAPYNNLSNLLAIDTARKMIRSATEKADLVVVYMHAGAEGAGATHVTRREEHAFGEDRGNPYKFAHMAVDNGADLVIASGPHVLRAMELYKHRLIAYSLGNFAAYHNFNTDGVSRLTGILRVTIGPKGWFKEGRFVSVKLSDAGRPSHDYSGGSAGLVNRLSRQDFPKRGVHVGDHGRIVPTA